MGRDASGFDAISARREIVLSEMHLGLDDGEFVAEMAESIVLVAVVFDFGGSVSVVEVGNSTTECVVSGGRAIKQGVEPDGNRLSDVL
jgi:hypothetical protein